MIPLVHDLAGLNVLIFGGGSVGARKANHFASEAAVTVLSPDFAPVDFGDASCIRTKADSAAIVEWIEKLDPALVVAATDDTELNDEIERIAIENRILCNRADRSREESEDRSPFLVDVPATSQIDPVVVSVSTNGTSPALSRCLRKEIEPMLDNADAMAELSGELRAELKQADIPPDSRREAIRRVVESDRVWKALDTESTNARYEALDVISEVTDRCLAGDQP